MARYGRDLLLRATCIAPVVAFMGYELPKDGYVTPAYGWGYAAVMTAAILAMRRAGKAGLGGSRLPLPAQGVLAGCLAGITAMEAVARGPSLVVAGWLVFPSMAAFHELFGWAWERVRGSVGAHVACERVGLLGVACRRASSQPAGGG